MTPASFIRHAMSVAAPAFAEEGEAAKEPKSSEEVIGDLPEKQRKAVQDAIEEAETPEGTTVIVIPPPEATMREYDPASETDQEAEAEERVPGETLHPEGED
ncbi:MAG: hypothetical protein JRI98_13025, partial [Deltaproteobacteria bacterium]|nr:hypothetical protein [Deltaproteobacteria bacterium]